MMINYSSQKYQKLKSKVKLFSFCFLDIYVNIVLKVLTEEKHSSTSFLVR